MNKAVSMDSGISWWVGLYSPTGKEDWIWNSTKEIQNLVESWAGEPPRKTNLDTETCAGFNISGFLHATDCAEQGYSPVCQFGE